MTLAYTFFVLVCLGLWCYYRYVAIETVSIDILTVMIWPPAIFLFLSYAVTILVLYGKNKHTAEGES